MKHFLLTIGLCIIGFGTSYGQIISQYIETNSGSAPKGIEIFNNTGSTLDFSTNNLVIKKGTNGAALSVDHTVSSGTLASGDVMVIGTSNIETYMDGEGLTSVLFSTKSFSFNGDDALSVEYGGVVTDVFGDPGTGDPGSDWNGNGVSTANQNIQLKSGITTGDTDGFTDPSTRFETVSTDPVNDLSGFGVAPASGGTATKLNISLVNSGDSPTKDIGFEVVVQALDASDQLANVDSDIDITFTLATGNGSIGGTTTGTITNGNSSITISGTTYDTAESGVSITVADDASGLTSATSSTFTVLDEATKLVIKDFPATGSSNTAVSSFTVEFQRSDDSIDENNSSSITIAKVSGTGNLGGTLTKSASDGIATFDDITFDADGSFTINATDGSLTSANSSSITISTAVAPTAGTVFITEISDAADDFNAEFIELYNSSSSNITLASTDLIRYSGDGASSEYTFSISSGTGSSVIPPNGFLIIARGATEAEFESEWGALEANTNFNEGNTNLFFGNGRRWVVKESSTQIDSTSNAVGTNRDFQFPVGSGTFVTGVEADATPGQLDGVVDISGDAGWRMLSFPISGGAAEDISDDTAIQGVSGGDNTGETSNFMTYDNTGAFETPASVSTNLGNGYGFIAYFYDNTDAGSSELPITLDAAGTEPSSDVSVDLNVSNTVSSSYYTMAGNPYATNFNLNSITATGGSIQNNVHFWDNGSDSYSALDRTTPYIVEPWQGFWVETTSSDVTAISMPTSGKTSSAATGTFFSKDNPNSGDINFTLSSETTFDKAIRLSARPNAVLGYDVDDASKFTPLVNSYATMSFVGEIENEDKLQSVFSVPSN
ncbi:MAG: lamin tail domain-containing protein, partial [Balneola sp.]